MKCCKWDQRFENLGAEMQPQLRTSIIDAKILDAKILDVKRGKQKLEVDMGFMYLMEKRKKLILLVMKSIMIILLKPPEKCMVRVCR